MKRFSLLLARGVCFGSRIVLSGVVPGFAVLTGAFGLACSALWALSIGGLYDPRLDDAGLETFFPAYYAAWPAFHVFAIVFGIVGRSENRRRRGPLYVSRTGILFGGIGVIVWAGFVVYAFVLVFRAFVGR